MYICLRESDTDFVATQKRTKDSNLSKVLCFGPATITIKELFNKNAMLVVSGSFRNRDNALTTSFPLKLLLLVDGCEYVVGSVKPYYLRKNDTDLVDFINTEHNKRFTSKAVIRAAKQDDPLDVLMSKYPYKHKIPTMVGNQLTTDYIHQQLQGII